ncbi:MAG: hypothetical protein KatS3mg013_1203 [Actinomycetota bacterium]|jgi:uncharacterized membrane protein|nr:MAG: hypothetical protein KatS3mg013_1203 [Actinomycetota bacterium]
MDGLRTLVLVLHVLGAIVALGFSLSYGLWLARGEASGAAERAFALRTISWIDRRVTTPAYVLQLVTGLLLVGLVDWGLLREAWLEISIGIYVVLVAIAMAAYAPAYRRQVELAQRLAAGEAVEPAYRTQAAVARRWGVLVTVLTVAIVVLMVWKPALWS